MALFTDGAPATVDDLAAVDSQLLSVAHAEGIDVTQKLALAQNDVGLELLSLLSGNSYREQWLLATPRPNLNAVVVTQPLLAWNVYRALELVYSDAYNSQLNDRYGGKRDQFHALAKEAYGKLREMGLGIVRQPLAKAATPTAVAAQAEPGDNAANGTYFAAAAWVNAAGEEGAASDAATVTTANSTFAVEAGAAPEGATGWNVYAGTDANNLSLQNATPVGVGEAWLQPGTPGTAGRQPGKGQRPNYFRPVPRVIQRG